MLNNKLFMNDIVRAFGGIFKLGLIVEMEPRGILSPTFLNLQRSMEIYLFSNVRETILVH